MRPWLYALLLSGCFPARYLEPDVGVAGPVPSPERGRRVLLNRSYLKVGVPVVLVDAVNVPKLAPDDELPWLEGREDINGTYDLSEHVGWEYTVPSPCAGPDVYDTAGYGKGNGGRCSST